MRAVPAALTALAAVLVSLPLPTVRFAAAQEAPPAETDETGLTPEAEQQELNDLLSLTLPQQKQRAQTLIRKYPGTPLSRVLQRLLDEYAVYDRIADAERAAREARTACYRAYWRERCGSMPPWNPPQARLVNETGGPVLYEIRIGGIYKTLWMGPYRLLAGGSYASPHPYCVRYLGGGGVQEQEIVPGATFAFQGAPGGGTLALVPSAMPPGGVAAPPPAPAPMGADAAPSAPEPAPAGPPAPPAENGEPAASAFEGPAMLPRLGAAESLDRIE